MASQDPEIRKRVVGNMNAGRREAHRNRIDPQRGLPPEMLEKLVDEAEVERLRDISRLGVAAQADARRQLRDFQDQRDELIEEFELFVAAHLERLRRIGVAA